MLCDLPPEIEMNIWKLYHSRFVLDELQDKVYTIRYHVVSGLTPSIDNDMVTCAFIRVNERVLLATDDSRQYYHYMLPYFDTIQMYDGDDPDISGVCHVWDTLPVETSSGMTLQVTRPRLNIRLETLVRIYFY